MSTNKRGSGKQKTIYPKTTKEKDLKIHNQYKQDYSKLSPSEKKIKNSIAYFKDEQGNIRYLDNKKGKYGYNNLATKLAGNLLRNTKLKNQTPTEEDAIAALGVEKGKTAYKNERQAVKDMYKGSTSLTDVDHMHSSANVDSVNASRNLRIQNALENRSDGKRTLSKFKKDILGITDKKNYFSLHGPWLPKEQVNIVVDGPDDPKKFAEYYYKKVKDTVENGVENGSKNGLKINGKNGKTLKIGGGLIAAATLTPTVKAAEQARQEVLAGNYGAAVGTIGKDLVVQQTSGEVAARGLKLASKVISSKLNPIVGKTIARTALKIVGKQVLKKGAALATGPAAPAIVAGMLVFDAYQAADALSGGALTQFFKPKQIKTKNFRKTNGRLQGSLNAT